MTTDLTASYLASDARLGLDGIIGDQDRKVDRLSSLNSARTGCLAFARTLAMVQAQGEHLAGSTIICPAPVGGEAVPDGVTLLLAENPRLAFVRITESYFLPPPPEPGIHPTAVIDPTAQIHPTAHVGAFCCVGAGSTIGENTTIYPHVVIFDRVHIGARCRISAGTVIGAEGFGYERNDKGELEKFPHLGGVTIADDVDIGSNTSIDRGTLDDTIIKARARIDNLVHVAHNVHIGEDAAVVALSMLGGSSRIGAGAWIAPGAILKNQIAVGDSGFVGLGAVVVKNVADGQTVMGSPAQDSVEFKATRAALAGLVNG